MKTELNRRIFLGASTLGAVAANTVVSQIGTAGIRATLPVPEGKTKVRIGKIYLGQPGPGWPKVRIDLAAERQKYEDEFAKREKAFEDVEFVGGELVSTAEQLQSAMEKFKDISGILVLHLSMGVTGHLESLLKLNVPVVVFALPYAGHEWHTIASMQKRGSKIEMHPSSDFDDLAVAIRPFRAIHRLREAKILYVNTTPPDAKYCEMIEKKFGTKVLHIDCPRMVAAYNSIPNEASQEEANLWIKQAEMIVEPSKEDIFKSSRMYLAMKKLLEEEKADTITINCLGLFNTGLPDAYPCLGFSRLSSMGLGGICEADLKSTMTHLIFMYLSGKPGFVTDPVVDLSDNTITHCHCVAPLKMDGVDGDPCKYIIRSHLEDGKGACLFVRMKIGQPISLARLIGDNIMLFSTGEIIDTPFEDRGCRTQIKTKVKDAQRQLENWSCGLHRVVFYEDQTRDAKRFCRFTDIRLVREDEENCYDIPGLEWTPSIHA